MDEKGLPRWTCPICKEHHPVSDNKCPWCGYEIQLDEEDEDYYDLVDILITEEEDLDEEP